jgi:hypothetical protein
MALEKYGLRKTSSQDTVGKGGYWVHQPTENNTKLFWR